jgi:hypothetical protein
MEKTINFGHEWVKIDPPVTAVVGTIDDELVGEDIDPIFIGLSAMQLVNLDIKGRGGQYEKVHIDYKGKSVLAEIYNHPSSVREDVSQIGERIRISRHLAHQLGVRSGESVNLYK